MLAAGMVAVCRIRTTAGASAGLGVWWAFAVAVFLALAFLDLAVAALPRGAQPSDPSVLEDCPSGTCRIVFVHVPKTGGSTFIQAMVAWSARHGHSFVRCMKEVTPQTCRGWTVIRNDTYQEATSPSHGATDGRKGLSFKEVPADVRGARVIFGHMAFAPLPHDDAVHTAYVTVLREPVSRIISHFNYVMPTRPFAAWYRHSVKHRACNLQVAYLAGMEHSGPLSSANNRCARVGEEHLHLACRHLRSNFSLIGLHDFHLEFDRGFLCLFGGMDAGAADMVLAHHATPHEHRGHHPAHFHPCALSSIQDDTAIEEIFEDNLLDVLLYLYAAVLLDKVPPSRWPPTAAGRAAAKRAKRVQAHFSKGRHFTTPPPQTQARQTMSARRSASACSTAMAFEPPSSPSTGSGSSTHRNGTFSVLQAVGHGGGRGGKGKEEAEPWPGRQHLLLHRLYSSALESALFRSLLAADVPAQTADTLT